MKNKMEQETIYVVSQKYTDGGWNKLVKSQELWWYTEKEAKDWLKAQLSYLQVSCAVFEVKLNIVSTDKVYDLANDAPEHYEKLKKQLVKSHSR